MAGGKAADGGAEGVLGAGDLEGAGHDRLNVAVAVVAQCVDDALAGDDADKLRAADDGEVLLQRMHAAGERVGQRVGGREGGKIGEHDFPHADGVDDGLEEDALVLNLRADHDEEAGDDEPVVLEGHAADHGEQGEALADVGGGAAGGGEAVLAGEAAADEAAAVERIGGHQVQQRQPDLHPDHAAQQVSRGDERLVEEADIAACAGEGGGQHQRRRQVGDRAGEGKNELGAAAVGILLAFGVGVGEEAAEGQQQHGAQAQAQPRGDDEAGDFAGQNGGNQHQEQAEAAAYPGGGAERQAHERQDGEEGVNAHLDAHPAAQRD